MDIVEILAVGALNIACFFVGSKIGQAVVKGKDIEAPTIKSPMKLYKEHKDNKEAEMERHRLEVIMGNIDRYDGTAKGQEDVPR